MLKKLLMVIVALVIISLVLQSSVFQNIIHALHLDELTIKNFRNLF